MIVIKSTEEIEKIRVAGRIVNAVLNALCNSAKTGITTAELDEMAYEMIIKAKCEPAFKGYKGYPATICASINDQVVHGIPSKKARLADGDIIGFDVGVGFDGYYADAARTVGVGKVSDKARELIDVTRISLEHAIEQAKEGNRVSDISHAVQSYVEDNGFNVVRHFVGHGVGKEIHEAPEIPNFGKPNKGARLMTGMVLAIEPMVNAGGFEVKVLDDGWTAVTKDGSLSAHFEHTIAVTKFKGEILT